MNERAIKEAELDAFDRLHESIGTLADMVEQFAYRSERKGVAVLHTGGHATLERAFQVLALPDPVPVMEFWNLVDEGRYKSWAEIKQAAKQ